MGQMPAEAPCKAAHSSRNRARRMKAARAEARRLVGEALSKRDSALSELSAVKVELAAAKREHELKCEEFNIKCAEMAAAVETAAQNAAASDEVENLKRVNAETIESLDSERGKAQSLLVRLGEVKDQLEGERAEKEEFRQEVLGLRSRLENMSGLSSDEVNGLIARAQEAEDRLGELSQHMTTLQNQADDRERQLEEARESCSRLKVAAGEKIKNLEAELDEIHECHEVSNETCGELRKNNAALADSIAKAKAELKTVSAERDELRGKLDGSAKRIEELEASLVAEREGTCRLRDSEQESASKIGDLAHEKETLALELAATQKAHADAVAALNAAQADNEAVKADLQTAREENHRQRLDHEQTVGELARGQERLREQVRAAQDKLDGNAAEYEKQIGELQAALDSKQGEVERAAQEAHRDELENLQKAVESERERADRAEGMARAAELLREDLETFKGKVGALRQQLSVCSSLKDDLADAESKLMEATAKASDAESRARAAERDSSRLTKELERVNLKLAEEASRADGASAALQEADGVKSLALPHGLLPGEVTTVAFGSGFQKFVVKKLIYRDDGSILAENGQGQSVPMGTWR